MGGRVNHEEVVVKCFEYFHGRSSTRNMCQRRNLQTSFTSPTGKQFDLNHFSFWSFPNMFKTLLVIVV